MDVKNLCRRFKVYISGPITGDPNAKERFAKVQNFLEEEWTVINPFDIGAELETEGRQVSWEEYMRVDVKALVSADFIFMLRGWRRSRGARLERKIAKALKIGILYQTKKQDKAAWQEAQK